MYGFGALTRQDVVRFSITVTFGIFLTLFTAWRLDELTSETPSTFRILEHNEKQRLGLRLTNSDYRPFVFGNVHEEIPFQHPVSVVMLTNVDSMEIVVEGLLPPETVYLAFNFRPTYDKKYKEATIRKNNRDALAKCEHHFSPYNAAEIICPVSEVASGSSIDIRIHIPLGWTQIDVMNYVLQAELDITNTSQEPSKLYISRQIGFDLSVSGLSPSFEYLGTQQLPITLTDRQHKTTVTLFASDSTAGAGHQRDLLMFGVLLGIAISILVESFLNLFVVLSVREKQ